MHRHRYHRQHQPHHHHPSLNMNADHLVSTDPVDEEAHIPAAVHPSTCFQPVPNYLARQLIPNVHTNNFRNNDTNPMITNLSDDHSDGGRYSDFSQASVDSDSEQYTPPPTSRPDDIEPIATSSIPRTAVVNHYHQSMSATSLSINCNSLNRGRRKFVNPSAQADEFANAVDAVDVADDEDQQDAAQSIHNSTSSLRRLLFQNKQKMSGFYTNTNTSSNSGSTARESHFQYYGVPVDHCPQQKHPPSSPAVYTAPYFVVDHRTEGKPQSNLLPKPNRPRPQPIRPIVQQQQHPHHEQLEQAQNATHPLKSNPIWKFLSRNHRKQQQQQQQQEKDMDRESKSRQHGNSRTSNNSNSTCACHHLCSSPCSCAAQHQLQAQQTCPQCSQFVLKTNNNCNNNTISKRRDWSDSFRLLRRSSNVTPNNSTNPSQSTCACSNTVCATSSPTSSSPLPRRRPSYISSSCSSNNNINQSNNNSTNRLHRHGRRLGASHSRTLAHFHTQTHNPPSPANKHDKSYGTLPSLMSPSSSRHQQHPHHSIYSDKREPCTFGGFRSRPVVTTEGSSVSSCSDREEDTLVQQHLCLSRRHLRAMQIN